MSNNCQIGSSWQLLMVWSLYGALNALVVVLYKMGSSIHFTLILICTMFLILFYLITSSLRNLCQKLHIDHARVPPTSAPQGAGPEIPTTIDPTFNFSSVYLDDPDIVIAE